MSKIEVSSTRGDKAIDRVFCNMRRSVVSSGTVPPLKTEHSTSNHRIVHVTYELWRQETFEWLSYSYRSCTEEARDDFGRWIVQQRWDEVLNAVGSDNKADALQETLDAAMDTFFPLRVVRRKSTDPHWVTKKIKKRIRRRKRIYRKEGRSLLWRAMKKATDEPTLPEGICQAWSVDTDPTPSGDVPYEEIHVGQGLLYMVGAQVGFWRLPPGLHSGSHAI